MVSVTDCRPNLSLSSQTAHFQTFPDWCSLRLCPEPSALLSDTFPVDGLTYIRDTSSSLQASEFSVSALSVLSHGIDNEDILISTIAYLLRPSDSTVEMSCYNLNVGSLQNLRTEALTSTVMTVMVLEGGPSEDD